MSHFSVLVIGSEVDEQLAPYQENNCGDCPEEYLVFRSAEEVYREEYENGKMEKVVMSDGSLKNQWDEEFRIDKCGFGPKTHKVPATLKIKDFPFKDLYTTFEDFLKDYTGLKKADDITGKYGFWENPNAKWDWYEIGGRWSGFFKLKEDVTYHNGKGSKGFVDSILKKDLDIEGMEQKAKEQAEKEYDTFEKATKGITPPKQTWEQFKQLFGENNNTKKEWSSHPWIKAIRDARLGLFLWECETEVFCIFKGGRKTYIQEAVDSSMSTFAIIKDGVWQELGKNSWCGSPDTKTDQKMWNQEIKNLINRLDDETKLTIVDCHI